CKIKNDRFKHQDYLDNAITLAYYDGSRNVKASDMRHLYIELANSSLSDMQPLLMKVNRTLDFMKRVNSYKKGIFKNKWAFVDTFFLIYKNLDQIVDINANMLAGAFDSFEKLRREHNSHPEVLIEDKENNTIYDKDLYEYIIAFKTSGADKNNTKTRHRVFCNKFLNPLNFMFQSCQQSLQN
ncbi:hypothetical protein, partial [Pontibacter burrus]